MLANTSHKLSDSLGSCQNHHNCLVDIKTNLFTSEILILIYEFYIFIHYQFFFHLTNDNACDFHLDLYIIIMQMMPMNIAHYATWCSLSGALRSYCLSETKYFTMNEQRGQKGHEEQGLNILTGVLVDIEHG